MFHLTPLLAAAAADAPVPGTGTVFDNLDWLVILLFGLGMIAVVYAGVSWAMAARTGNGHVVAAAGAQGPGLLFGLGGGGVLSQAAQWLFLTSLFAAALAFHNSVWRYIFALGRENVLPAALGRTGGNNIPKAASLVQSGTGLAVIAGYALAHADPMTSLFFDLGTTGGFGILVLLAVTSVAVIAFFARDWHGENVWRRLVAPAARRRGRCRPVTPPSRWPGWAGGWCSSPAARRCTPPSGWAPTPLLASALRSARGCSHDPLPAGRRAGCGHRGRH